jgi:hypothetical protein
MSTISWSYSAAGAGDAKASPAEACTMVVENARAVLCRENERLEEKEDLAACWATNLLELRSGALTMVLRAAALAKLRLAMALIADDLESVERRGRIKRRRLHCNDFSMATEERNGWWWKRELLKPTIGSGAVGHSLGLDLGDAVHAWIACCRDSEIPENVLLCGELYPCFLSRAEVLKL